MERVFVILQILLFCSAVAGCDNLKSDEGRTHRRSIVGTWTPLSRAFVGGGDMTIDESTIAWANGERVTYEVIKESEDEYLVRVRDTGPCTGDACEEFMRFKFAPHVWAPNDPQKYQLEVTFYEKEADIPDKQGAWGVYFPNEKSQPHD